MATDRSTSRGRDALTSAGRGGLGNIHSPSPTRERPTDGPDDFSHTRSREIQRPDDDRIRSTGRGGAGNFRSPSRDTGPETAERERERIRAHEQAELGAVHSSGRGGLGNMSNSRSPSGGPSSPLGATPVVHSSGRGGAGNIAPGAAPAFERGRPAAPADDKAHMHSTGRGGLANLTSAASPPPDVPHAGAHPHAFATGRGGAGNIVSQSVSPPRTREGSRGGREESKDRTSKERGLAGLWGRIQGHQPSNSNASVPSSGDHSTTSTLIAEE
ncbi:hypothetical protein C8J57DRAFT_1345399 [Mycena rebaudengoi]|nr:hypothetical protein C8J57DRAFT_1345399 [Mycena rebaudengoi]